MFDEERLEVFFCGLLRVKANRAEIRIFSDPFLTAGRLEIFLCLLDPFESFRPHTA